ncbi:MAG TPA: UdgX family uracil-DNA binding protein [Rhizomicrobium sp.]|nr:UdgX family uracil-DNA binding protein [Rhizomicrobium sp.]
MRTITLASQTDFAGWRAAARGLLAQGVAAADVTWTIEGEIGDLLSPPPRGEVGRAPARPGGGTVPREFLSLAETVIEHRNPARFALLYDLLWRLQRDKALLSISFDPLVSRIEHMAKAVGRDKHKMHAFVRFREVQDDDGLRFIAWFEPMHYIVESNAGFFIRRFPNMRWSILTPDLCAHWDRNAVSFTPGATKDMAPDGDRLEDAWRTYYASIFNPARLKVKMMTKEMPQKYWRNLPEAALIKPLISSAPKTTGAMIEAVAPESKAHPHRMVGMAKVDLFSDTPEHLRDIRKEAAHCKMCPLYKDATQTVFGEGPEDAHIMFVGEQPGDKEDLAGKPFVGPAGQLLDKALDEAGIDRGSAYVTNAVKHFKFTPRGKIRLHQKPNTTEVRACNPWLQKERAIIKPKLIVALGATAAQGVFGKAMPIGKNRGQMLTLDDGTTAMITVHPSYLLRILDQDKEREYAGFVKDLKLAARFIARAKAA